jgi:tetratricopeptide (TPR) repeat protein
MLLDQKRTKRMVKIVSIIAALAFAGVIFVVLGVILAGGGGGGDGTGDLLKEAQERVRTEPRNPAAWEDLASQYASQQRLTEAIPPAERAVQLAPDDYSRLQTLVSLLSQSNDHNQAVVVLQRFTARNPQNADAFIDLGIQAEQAGKPALAQLAYGSFLRLLPNDTRASAVRQKLKELRGGGTTTGGGTGAGGATTPTTPATPETPATPATP